MQEEENVPETGKALMMKKVLIKQEKKFLDLAQRIALFRICCNIQGKCCKVLIKIGSTGNLVYIEVIEKFKLKNILEVIDKFKLKK